MKLFFVIKGIRTGMWYVKNAFKMDDLLSKRLVIILFSLITAILFGASYGQLKLLEGMMQTASYETFNKFLMEFSAGNTNLSNEMIEKLIDATYDMVPSMLLMSAIAYAGSLLMALALVAYKKLLLDEYVAKRMEEGPVNDELAVQINMIRDTSIGGAIAKAFVIQLTMLPFFYFSNILGSSSLIGMLLYSVIQSIFVFAILFSMETGLKNKITSSIKYALGLFQGRFFRVTFTVLLIVVLNSLIFIVVSMLSEMVNIFEIEIFINSFVLAILNFVEIRYIFFLYRDLAHPIIVKQDFERFEKEMDEME